MKPCYCSSLILLCIILITVGITVYKVNGTFNLAATASLTVTTDTYQYVLRQNVNVSGRVSLDGSPASNMLVSVEVVDSQPPPLQQTLIYRTVPIGSPNEAWLLQIADIFVLDQYWNPIDTIKIGNNVYFAVTIYNPQYFTVDPITVTISISDGNNIPIQAFQVYEGSIELRSNLTVYQLVNIPKSAPPGKAYIRCNVYDRIPSEGGVPYLPEKSAEFYLSLTDQGLFGQLPLPMRTYDSSPANGSYELTFKLSSAPEPGDYTVYATGRYSPISRTTNITTFKVLDIASPPQASFTYTPAEPYPNQTTTFDGSSSTAEGYGDVIIQYEWDFGDGTAKVVKSGNATNPPDPTTTHKFMASGQYIVTLNVTDTEGFWCTTQKPIRIKQTNPTAAFTWNPLSPLLNRTVTFNATSSLPGWSIPKATLAPIVNYIWNFGDSSANSTTTTPTIDHIYTTPGNFTVTLTVIDSENQRNAKTQKITVQNKTSPVYDINGDGKVDIRDVAIVAKAFGSYPGAPNWNPQADITGPQGVPDGKVDIRDVALVSKHFGEIL